jgi:hypothetical protein
MLPKPRKVHESQIEKLDFLFFTKLQYVGRGHGNSPRDKPVSRSDEGGMLTIGPTSVKTDCGQPVYSAQSS